ncbi:MAG: hypothetical protein ACR2JB_30585 [Bryobacteraceae bacterium]
MNSKRPHVVIPEQLVKEIDTFVGSRQRSSFLTQAAERELMRLRQLKALDSAAGAWKDSNHPELKQGSAKWVRKLRQQNEARLKTTARKLNERKERRLLLHDLVSQGHLLACCAINVAEIYAGVRPKEEKRTETLLQSLQYLPIPFSVARLGGLMKRDYSRKAKRLPSLMRP